MTRSIKPCIDRILPADATARAIERSLSARADDPGLATAGGQEAPRERYRMAVETARAWEPGRTVSVRFLEGDSWVHGKVLDVASEWSEHANVAFRDAGRGDGEIRVAFASEGHWSAVGKEATEYKQKWPTMNLEGFTRQTSDDEYRRVVLHEFGHALGCIHEHSSPGAGIPWDRDAVYAFYSGPPNHWNADDVELNIFKRYAAEQTQFTAFDPESIMVYAIPPHLTGGKLSTDWNRDLSPTDRAFIALLYPRVPSEIRDVSPNGAAGQGEIRVAGEQNHFRFNVVAGGAFVIETMGWIDTYLTVFGPNTFAITVGEDDNSGLGENARLESYLEPGQYFARVVHKRPDGTGRFELTVRPTSRSSAESDRGD